uniref:Histidine phosphatase family protein n=1 Tax=Fundidesulfovibrio putealis TaxID=270496 RepID=A0A7C3WG98_9BACT
MTRIALIRHGLTQWNVLRRIQGGHDSPLTPEGEAACTAWADALRPLNPTALYSSPLGRAMHTARLVGCGLGLEPQEVPGLSEQLFGDWTGRTVEELRVSGELPAQEAYGWAFLPPGGEDRATVLLRTWAALQTLAGRHPGQCILAVTHESVIRGLLYALLGRDYLPQEPRVLSPRALHILRAEGGCLHLEAMNLPL